MSDLTTRSREAAQRDIAVAALESICEGISDAHDSATELDGAYRTIAGTALWRIAEIGATAPPQAPPGSAMERARKLLDKMTIEWNEQDDDCAILAAEFEQADEARAEIARLNDLLGGAENQIDRLTALPGASAIDRARQVYNALFHDPTPNIRSHAEPIIARAIEQAEREARAAAIEEAARVAEHGYVQYAGDIRVGLAAEIRALAAAPPEPAP